MFWYNPHWCFDGDLNLATLKKVLQKRVTDIRKWRAKSSSKALASSEIAEIRLVGLALNNVLKNDFTPAQISGFKRIEDHRAELLKLDSVVNLVDYGAGASGDNRSKTQMDKGVRFQATASEVARASKSEFWAKVLHQIVLGLKPQRTIELGTCVGISAAYQAFAMQLNSAGTLTTLEGAPEVARIAESTLDRLDFTNAEVVVGPFQTTLQSTLEATGPVDYFYNDGHHDRDAVIEYFNLAYPYMRGNSVIIIDDISWSAGMKTAWSEIENDSRVLATVDLHQIGIAVVGDRNSAPNKYRIPL